MTPAAVIALIVDDHPLARRGLATILKQSLDIQEIIEADDDRAAVAAARTRRPGIVLLDMHMPRSRPARETCGHLRSLLPRTPIVLVTAFDHTTEIRDCLRAGASGCLLKDTAVVDLARGLRNALQNQPVIDPRIAHDLAALNIVDGRGASIRLTGRERDVLSLLAEGCSNRTIAERLVISQATVKGHVSNLIVKLGASSRLEVVARAGDARLL